ncbi:hypothetical protein LDO26_14380 [Luteimonas sp. BDR2-5]|uniref:hypothetical protein n=1 Tax=Proluteimonas luteida TaxID=2878685 RepID=UPI001E35179C|nr:hypothetical protein [Luteimonas sp. BDR2-5]MCD9029380.1 hypothetical protein [Luteimonas sp. BDR2-5]
MALRPELEHALDALAAMLPVWLEKLRVREAFWPQFDALSRQILARATTDAERVGVQRRLDAMLAAHDLRRPCLHRRDHGVDGGDGSPPRVPR